MSPTTGTAPLDGVAGAAGAARPGPVARAALAAIRLYQLVRVGRLSPCRFTPTCSEYAAVAVTTHGARHGAALTARRLARCRPGGPFGYDPVPPPRNHL